MQRKNMNEEPAEWAEAPHHGLARLSFRAFYHPLELPQLPSRINFSNRTESNTTSTRWEELAQLALHNPHIWANSLKPVCFLCFLLFWCPLLPFIETCTLKIYTKMVLYMKNEFLTSNTPHGV